MLKVIVDGTAMPEEDARAFWKRFSAHLEANRGDLAGFAAAEGYASVHPETVDGVPVLIVSKTAPQRAYANAPRRQSEQAPSGSGAHHLPGKAGSGKRGGRGKRR
jgi:hypothetical protein